MEEIVLSIGNLGGGAILSGLTRCGGGYRGRRFVAAQRRFVAAQRRSVPGYEVYRFQR
jgi:hypothetical protein